MIVFENKLPLPLLKSLYFYESRVNVIFTLQVSLILKCLLIFQGFTLVCVCVLYACCELCFSNVQIPTTFVFFSPNFLQLFIYIANISGGHNLHLCCKQ